MATIDLNKLAAQDIVFERGMVREVISVHDITDWWDATIDGGPVALGEATKRIIYDEGFPQHGDRLVDAGGLDVMPGRPLYIVDMDIKLKDSNRAQLEVRYEYLGSKNDEWTEVDGSLYQIQTYFDNQDPPQPITVSHANTSGTPIVQGVEVPANQPRRRAAKTYGRFLQPGETQSSLVGAFLGRVNATEYQEGEPGTWMVMNMKVVTKVEPIGTKRPLIQITVEIEHDPRGHKLYAYWRDPLTGLPGVDLVEDEGYKRVDFHEAIEFDTEFGP